MAHLVLLVFGKIVAALASMDIVVTITAVVHAKAGIVLKAEAVVLGVIGPELVCAFGAARSKVKVAVGLVGIIGETPRMRRMLDNMLDKAMLIEPGLVVEKTILGTIALVRGKTHQVYGQFLKVDLDLSGALGRVDMECDLAGTADLTDSLDILDDTDLVVHMHDRDQDGIVTQRVF